MALGPSSVFAPSRIAVLACGVFLGSLSFATNDPFLGHEGSILPNPYMQLVQPSGFTLLTDDFNEDGFQDLVMFSTPVIQLLLGNGDCTFSATYHLTFTNRNGALGDLDEDGHRDVVASGGGGAKVLLGNGDGSLGDPLQLVVPASGNHFPFSVAVADFDNDNNEDVVVVNFNSGQPIGFFAGNGDGTFADVVTSGDGRAFEIAVGDLDNNGNLDLVVDAAWMGSGNGSFTQIFFGGSSGFSAEGQRVFDFDGDTHLDVVTAYHDSAVIGVRLGNGDGTFAGEAAYPVGIRPRYVLVHDVDGDENADLVVAHQKQSLSEVPPDSISVLPGNGDGTFDPATEIRLVNHGGPLAIADFDNDGHDDLAVIQDFNQLTILTGREDGFTGADPAAVKTYDPHGEAVAAAFGDLNKDGFTDVVRVREGLPFPVTIMVGDGDGGFVLSAIADAGTGVSDVAIADFDNDTHADVIITNSGSSDATILSGNGDGTFAPPVSVPLIPGPGAIVTGLFDEDANVDIAVLGNTPGPSVFILTGNGDTTFSPASFQSVGTDPVSVHTGDFDEDGVIDLVIGNEGSVDLSVVLGNGDGTFQLETRYGVSSMSSAALSVADVNDDGHQDLLLKENEVLFGAGDGTFAAVATLLPDPGLFVFTQRAADMNGDGRTDLVGREASLRLGNGDGTFGAPSFFGSALGYPLLEMALDDVNGDGRLDLLVTDEDEIVTLLNIEAKPFNFLNDKITLRWPDVDDALSYNVYRGLLSDLADVDDDGLPDTGYGACQNAMDSDTTDHNYVDASVPDPGSGYFYLAAVVDGAGERWLGTTSDGLVRVPAMSCP